MTLVLSGVRKLRARPATWVTGGLLIGLLSFILIAVGATADRFEGPQAGGADPLTLVTFPGAFDGILSFLLGLGGLFAVIFGAAIAGSEWQWGTLRSAVARGEGRSRYVLATFASIGIWIAVGLLLAFAVGVVAAFVGATLAGVSTSGVSDAEAWGRLPGQFARGFLSILETGAIGFTVATLARSQLAGIGVGIALYFGETFARVFLPDIVKFLPFDVATAAVGGASGASGAIGAQASGATLSPDAALVLVIVWLVGALVVAAVATERAEIT